eukprot:TRINITY_DN9000_c0_g2_i5.p1 TRINITY_DN9000_c0_g2~~TRINITY_DN9000_c0_g2_i5.p1  ORF type:complete len:140 (-),score=18.24 TRINITY_DN9000_c0_g2_i5:1098-1493(-)
MDGHKSVVSSLAVCNGILYSGSWDGTVRLWLLSDHSPLAVLEDESSGNIASVLSLSVDRHMLVASYENGHVKVCDALHLSFFCLICIFMFFLLERIILQLVLLCFSPNKSSQNSRTRVKCTKICECDCCFW